MDALGILHTKLVAADRTPMDLADAVRDQHTIAGFDVWGFLLFSHG